MVGELNVFNSLGEKTISDWVSGSASYSIDLSAQSSGVYYLRFISDEGAVVQKLIIQK
jgi:hypothetical protein